MGQKAVDVAVVRPGRHVRQALLALAAIALVMGALNAGVSTAQAGEVVLRKGDRGPAVAKVQRKLRLSADGVFGPVTHKSVKRFQRRKRLEADGIVGPQTRRALKLRPFKRSEVRKKRRKRRRRARGSLRLPPILIKIAECESGGNPRAVSPDGRYRGKYQFLRSTWRHWGGRGKDPAKASERHQDRVALRLYRARGTAPWPSCA